MYPIRILEQTDDVVLVEAPERRTPATKKNRVNLDTTVEEDETPPPSPKPALELSTSPPYETKVRQISMRVRGLKWEDRPPLEITQEASETSSIHAVVAIEGQEPLAPAASISSSGGASPTAPQDTAKQIEESQTNSTQGDMSGDVDVLATQGGPPESDSEDQDKNLKRKMGEDALHSAVDRPSSTSGVEPAKRARDDAEEDDNPREKKRPSPPPDEPKAGGTEERQPAAPQPKLVSIIFFS